MELGLSLGNRGLESARNNLGININCMGLGLNNNSNKGSSPPLKLGEDQDQDQDDDNHNRQDDQLEMRREKMGSSSSDGSLKLHLLPLSPVVPRRNQPPPLRFPWLPPDTLSSEPGSSDGPGSRVVDVNRRGAAEEVEEQSSPNSGTSSFMEFSLYTRNNGGGGKAGRRENHNDYYGQEAGGMEIVVGVGTHEQGHGGGERVATLTTTTTTNSRGSDDEENGNSSTRKKLRLSKEQSAFLEDNFKEHHTLNPKQKLELAKQLNLRPRQVEVWFQNRRARTKLKQTEVDCEYLKRCCETLTEENRRLQKELQDLRALKTSQPFFMHLPATTLTMCPSCERVAPTTGPATTTVIDSNITLSLGKPKPKPKPMLPFSQAQAHQAPS